MAQQTLISTAMLPVKQRLEFWHDSVCKHFASLELGVHNEDLSKDYAPRWCTVNSGS